MAAFNEASEISPQALAQLNRIAQQQALAKIAAQNQAPTPAPAPSPVAPTPVDVAQVKAMLSEDLQPRAKSVGDNLSTAYGDMNKIAAGDGSWQSKINTMLSKYGPSLVGNFVNGGGMANVAGFNTPEANAQWSQVLSGAQSQVAEAGKSILDKAGDVASAAVHDPALLFYAATGGQGGMTAAQAATGGDVGKGALTDAAVLGGTYAAPGLAATLGGGVTGAVGSGAVIGGTTAGLTGNDITTGALLGAGGGAIGNLMFGGTPTGSAPLPSTETAPQPSSLAEAIQTGAQSFPVSAPAQIPQVPLPPLPSTDMAALQAILDSVGPAPQASVTPFNTVATAAQPLASAPPIEAGSQELAPITIAPPVAPPAIDLTQAAPEGLSAAPSQTTLADTLAGDSAGGLKAAPEATIGSTAQTSLADVLAANAAGGLKTVPEAASMSGAISGASGATGISGITPGLSTEGAVTGLGGGLSAPGVTGLGSTGVIGAAGAGMGALGETFGSASPVTATGSATGNAAAGGTGLGTTGTAAAAGAGGIGATKVGDVLSGDVGLGDALGKLTIGDLSKTLGTLGLTAGSIIGDNKTADALKSMNDQYMAIGAPSRSRYEASFAPGFDINSLPGLQGAMDTSYQSLLRGLSTQGNPYGNPGGLTEALKYVTGNVALPALNQYRNQNAATGGFGAFSTAAPGAVAGAINAQGNVYADLGRGAANIFSPPSSLQDALRSLRGLT